MPDYKYLIVGGGMTAASAVAGIREVDPNGAIALVSKEPTAPYDRPPLSKGLWKGKPVEKIWRDVSQPGLTVQLGRTITAVDAAAKQATDNQGETYQYDRLLLATGGKPNRLPFGGDDVVYFRSFKDYERLRAQSGEGKHFAVIGGGFIGSELAAALTMTGGKVTMLFPEDGIGALAYPHDLSQFVNGYYRDHGVEVLAGELVSGIDKSGSRLEVKTRSGKSVTADGVVAGIGIRPNVELAEALGLKVENGILVDEHLQTSAPDIYAAGDVASFYNPALGRRMRVEHEDNANTMGKAAGRAMAGQAEPYTHLPYFYSDLFDLGYEAVGELNPKLETVEDWQEPFQKGVVYYLDQGRVRGVLLWNVWDQVPNARALIAEPGPFTAANLKGRLPA
jgi:3-phenylpropionate/trans-cinnamate dioxygenase ferredoxin reductase component